MSKKKPLTSLEKWQDPFEGFHAISTFLGFFLAGWLVRKGVDSLIAYSVPIVWFVVLFVLKRKLFGKIWSNKDYDQDWNENYPPGTMFKVSDKTSGDTLGTLKSERIKALIDIYRQYGVEGNDFLFCKPGHSFHGKHSDLEWIAKEEKFPQDLYDFIRKHVYERGEIIFHWEKSSAV